MKTAELGADVRPVTRDEMEALVWALSGTRNTNGVARLLQAIDAYVAWKVHTAQGVEWRPSADYAQAHLMAEERASDARERANAQRQAKRVAEKAASAERAVRDAQWVPGGNGAGATVRERMEAVRASAVALGIAERDAAALRDIDGEAPPRTPSPPLEAEAHPVAMVVCSKCGVLKKQGDGGEFTRDASRKSGYHSQCKACRGKTPSAQRRAGRARMGLVAGADGKRPCKECGVPKFEKEFYPSKNGLRGTCKQCDLAGRKARRELALAMKAVYPDAGD